MSKQVAMSYSPTYFAFEQEINARLAAGDAMDRALQRALEEGTRPVPSNTAGVLARLGPDLFEIRNEHLAEWRDLDGLANLWKAQQDPDKMARLASSLRPPRCCHCRRLGHECRSCAGHRSF